MDMEIEDNLEAGIDILDKSPPNEVNYDSDIEDMAAEKHWLFFCGNVYCKPLWITLYNNFHNKEDARFVTFTFKPMLRDRLSEKELRMKLKYAIKHAITTCKSKLLKSYLRMVLIPEYDDVGNFHYHGIVSGLNRMHLCNIRRVVTNMIGFCKIEVPKNIINVYLYITKDIAKNTIDYELMEKKCLFSKVLL